MSSILVSLTSIPPRFMHLEHTIKSIFAQTKPADYIIINIPKVYSRFPNNYILSYFMTNTPNIILNMVDVDYGPATKLLGLQSSPIYKDLSADSIIICIDDDRVYNPNMIETFMSYINEHEVLTVAGWDISTISKNALSHEPTLLPRGIEFTQAGYIDILGGCCSFALTKNKSPLDDPDIYLLSPDDPKYYVDDVWISGFLTKNNIPIYMIPNDDAKRSHNDYVFPLYDHTRTDKNIACILYFREKYNIWN